MFLAIEQAIPNVWEKKKVSSFYLGKNFFIVFPDTYDLVTLRHVIGGRSPKRSGFGCHGNLQLESGINYKE